ncbi:MAG: hypothetical protein JWQ97_3550, partial [Phenylobacterium sp.]|nr:hypothetical protein [Phenylobacterium sp.]
MDRAALALDLTGHRDGFAVWFADCVVDIFPSFDGARAGFQAA